MSDITYTITADKPAAYVASQWDITCSGLQFFYSHDPEPHPWIAWIPCGVLCPLSPQAQPKRPVIHDYTAIAAAANVAGQTSISFDVEAPAGCGHVTGILVDPTKPAKLRLLSGIVTVPLYPKPSCAGCTFPTQTPYPYVPNNCGQVWCYTIQGWNNNFWNVDTSCIKVWGYPWLAMMAAKTATYWSGHPCMWDNWVGASTINVENPGPQGQGWGYDLGFADHGLWLGSSGWQVHATQRVDATTYKTLWYGLKKIGATPAGVYSRVSGYDTRSSITLISQ